jgi:LysM repeat protein
MYNVPPKEIASYNNLDFVQGLNLGQRLNIPITQNNFLQQEAANSDETLIPVYHVIEAKEGLYRVSTKFNKVPARLLKKWNNLSSDAVSSGTKLIVGYLKVQQDQSSLANNTITSQADDVNKKNEDETTRKPTPDAPTEVVPPIKNPDQAESSTGDSKNNSAKRTGINFNGGSFKNLYEEQQQLSGKTPLTENGLSGVFKSTSGWQDGKYYCFHNAAQPGTIIKITNSVNGKSIYAKVLDLIPDIKQNAGLILHVSNSGADELGIGENQFDCTINYAK